MEAWKFLEKVRVRPQMEYYAMLKTPLGSKDAWKAPPALNEEHVVWPAPQPSGHHAEGQTGASLVNS